MKKLLLIALIAFGINAKAQIALEHTYDSASSFYCNSPTITDPSTTGELMIINFEVSGERYVKINKWGRNISIYDLNHSLLKTISLASFTLCNSFPGDILYLSEKLFDTDNAMEFMYLAQSCGAAQPYYITNIYKENGILMFSDTSFPAVHPHWHMQQYPIYNTSQGTKMILSVQGLSPNVNEFDARVFSLPGILSMGIQDGNNQLLAQSSLSNAYPNPTASTTRIDYTFPKGVNQGEIVFYDLQGKEIKRYKVDKTFDHLLISTADIPAGTYFFQLQTGNQASEGKKIVVIK